MQITFKLKLGVSKRHTGGEWGGGEVFVAQSILCGPRDHSPPGSSVHRILQARTLEWPFPSPGDLSNPGIEPSSPALQEDSLPSGSPGEPGVVGWECQ